MTQPRDFQAEVIKRLLSEVDADGASAGLAHLDDETLALLVEGSLSSKERAAALEHLAVCPDCRRTTSLLLSDVQTSEEKVTLLRSSAWITQPIVAWAAAAMLLVAAVGLLFRPWTADRPGDNPPGQIATSNRVPTGKEKSPSPETERPPAETLADSGSSGRSPDSVANVIGRLTDYGYDFDGTKAQMRDWSPGQVKSAEPLPDGDDLTSLLNRGQLLLKSGYGKQAAAAFENATQRFPKSALAWLGLGLAHYIGNDMQTAAKEFRIALELDPKNQAAQLNLAVTLQIQQDWDGALRLWKLLLQENPTAADRERIQQQIHAIEAERTKSENR